MTTPVRRLLRSVMVLGLASGLASCATGPDVPHWVQGKPHGDFPEEQYTSGVGSGAQAEAAAEAAVAEVARKTSGEREGAKIERTWIDEKGKVHWALAVLDRTAEIERLAGELAATDARLAETLATIDPNGSSSATFMVVLRAVELAAAREGLATRIVHLGGKAPPSDPARTRATLEDQLASLRHTITIDVEAWEMDSKTGMLGDPLEEVRVAMAQEVLGRGFRIASPEDWTPSTGWLLIRGRVGIESLDLGASDRFVAVEWNAVVEISDRTGDGEALAILTREGRSTHLNEQEARRGARKQAEAFVVEALADWMDERTMPRS